MTKNEKKLLVGFDYEDPKACLEAVKQDGLALRDVRNQTEEICLAAVKVKEDDWALSGVNDEFLYLFD